MTCIVFFCTFILSNNDKQIKTMTANQITKQLAKAGIATTGLTIEKDMIEVCAGYYERDGKGFCDEAKTKKLTNQIKKALPSYSKVSSTRYGASILWFNYSGSSLASQNID